VLVAYMFAVSPSSPSGIETESLIQCKYMSYLSYHVMNYMNIHERIVNERSVSVTKCNASNTRIRVSLLIKCLERILYLIVYIHILTVLLHWWHEIYEYDEKHIKIYMYIYTHNCVFDCICLYILMILDYKIHTKTD
jgi:hypothetical protein